jgi:hypothetical protein
MQDAEEADDVGEQSNFVGLFLSVIVGKGKMEDDDEDEGKDVLPSFSRNLNTILGLRLRYNTFYVRYSPLTSHGKGQSSGSPFGQWILFGDSYL